MSATVRLSLKAWVLLLVSCLGTVGSASILAEQCDSAQYTYSFTSYCPFPIWIGQTSRAATQSYPPEGGNWALAGRCAADSQCPAGQSCNTDKNQCTCTQDSDCAGEAPCVAGLCQTTATFCMPQAWSSGVFWPRTGCVVNGADADKLTCVTGQCGVDENGEGQLDCGAGADQHTPLNPVTLFEVTSVAGGVGNYDVSLNAGYNVETRATPVVTSDDGGSASCAAAGCITDLNAACPSNLRDTVAPVAAGPVACGSGFCAAGQYCDTATSQCVVGCLDPCTQCSRTQPTASATNTIYTNLKCADEVDSFSTYTDCAGGIGSVLYKDMYCAKNTQTSAGHAQASSNQGTATCFSDTDCPAGSEAGTRQQCLFIDGFPDNVAGRKAGICVDPNPDYHAFSWAPGGGTATKSCMDNVGLSCGGYDVNYPEALGYTCREVQVTLGGATQQTTIYPCLPLPSPGSTSVSGLGVCTEQDSGGNVPLYTGVGGLFNPAWLAAGTQAGDSDTPYYAAFKTACPNSYVWQYDDAASGYSVPGAACNPNTGTVKLSGFNVSFCKSLSTPKSRLRGDAMLRKSRPHTNEGANPTLVVEDDVHGILGFDLPVQGGDIRSAVLILTLREPAEGWGVGLSPAGRLIGLRRLPVNVPAEGNGREWQIEGNPSIESGSGVTWACANDTDISNSTPDCAAGWNGGLAVANPVTSHAVLTTGQVGEVRWGVTADVIGALTEGRRHIQWLVVKADPGQNGRATFYSREGAMREAELGKAPRLELEFY